jgi:hypothetical protein
MANIPNDVAAILRGYKTAIENLQAQNQQLAGHVNQMNSRPRSIQEEIDAIEGRRIESTLSGEVTFTAADVGQRAAPIVFQVSQDGPFIMTHYPLALWRPTAPTNATNLNRWRPVTTFPLPTQVVGTDIIDILYELNDGGSQRLGQNEPRGPLLSRPDNIVPCPIPTVWSPNAAILFQPTYLALTWNGTVPPTQGTLHVDLVGYRIVNL